MLETARRSNSDAINARVQAAIARLTAADAPISFYSVAKEAYVARSTLYRRPELKALVEAARRESLSQVRTRSSLGNECGSDIAALQKALAAAEAEIARLLALEMCQGRNRPSFVYVVSSF